MTRRARRGPRIVDYDAEEQRRIDDARQLLRERQSQALRDQADRAQRKRESRLREAPPSQAAEEPTVHRGDAEQASPLHVDDQQQVRAEDTELGGSPWPWQKQKARIKDAFALPPLNKDDTREPDDYDQAPHRLANYDDPDELSASMTNFIAPTEEYRAVFDAALRAEDERLADYMRDYWNALVLVDELWDWWRMTPDAAPADKPQRRGLPKLPSPGLPDHLNQWAIAQRYDRSVQWGYEQRQRANLIIRELLRARVRADQEREERLWPPLSTKT